MNLLIQIIYQILYDVLKNRFRRILGVAGRKEKGGSVVSNILQGQNLQYAGKERVKSLIRCEVIDECFFGGYTDNFIKHLLMNKLAIIGIYMRWRVV